MTFQDVMSLGNTIATVGWMVITYQIFKLQFKTFNIQADTFKEQQRVTEMSSLKFLYDIRPIFEGTTKRNEDDINVTICSYELRVTGKSIAKNFTIIEKDNFLSSTEFGSDLTLFPLEKNITIFQVKVLVHELQDKIKLVFQYEDEIGTVYKQSVFGNFVSLTLAPPEMIK